jgi:transposase-like protein
MVSFKGAHVPQYILLPCVRWYVAYPLSYRHVEARMEERGVSVDHATSNRWVLKYSPHHRAVKRVTRPMLGFKAFEAAQRTLTGVELMHRIKKGQRAAEAGDEGLTPAEQFYALAA